MSQIARQKKRRMSVGNENGAKRRLGEWGGGEGGRVRRQLLFGASMPINGYVDEINRG